MTTFYSAHPMVFQTAYSDLKRRAFEQTNLLAGTPGTVGSRIVKGREYLYRQFYDARGKKAADYLGSAGDAEAERKADSIRSQIEIQKQLVREGRLLAEQGYARADIRTGSVLAALVNAGLFRAGALLVGSHAFGALINDLGVASAPYQTEDVDIARRRPLEVGLPDGADFLSILRDSTVPFHPVPSLARGGQPTSFKPPGPDRLRVDLLVPGRGREIETREVRELRAHATAIPYLGYLLEDSKEAVVIARECIAPVRVPRPERFAWHKMLVAELRDSGSDKSAKDLWQATVLVAVLAEYAPDDLVSVARALPTGAAGHVRRGAARARSALEGDGCDRALEVLDDSLG